MSSFIPFDRSQPYLLPPDLKSWLPADDMAHFVVAAVKRVPMNAFCVPVRTGGKAQYHPHLMLALLIFSYANGIFSSRRIERATYRDIGIRFVAANLHPDHDTIATFRRTNRAAIEAAFAQVLLLARETGLLRLGVVSIDGTKIDADASKCRSVRYARIRALREQLAVDIAELMEQAERADTMDTDPQALPEELARRETLKAKLDEACAQMEADAKGQPEAARPACEKKKAAYDATTGRRAGLRNYQKHHGLQKIQPARSCKSRLNGPSLHSHITAEEWRAFRQHRPCQPQPYEPQNAQPDRLLEEFVTDALILYPWYVGPMMHIACKVKKIVERFENMHA